jgi:hypothetical protein
VGTDPCHAGTTGQHTDGLEFTEQQVALLEMYFLGFRSINHQIEHVFFSIIKLWIFLPLVMVSR